MCCGRHAQKQELRREPLAGEERGYSLRFVESITYDLGHKRLQMDDSTRWRAKAKGGSLGIHVACCRIKLQSSLKITTATSSIASPGLEIKPSSFARSPNGVSPTRPCARSPQQVLFRHTYAGHRLQEIQREGCCDNDAHS